MDAFFNTGKRQESKEWKNWSVKSLDHGDFSFTLYNIEDLELAHLPPLPAFNGVFNLKIDGDKGGEFRRSSMFKELLDREEDS